MSFNKVIDKHNHEVNAVIGGFAPGLHQMPDRLVAAMLVNILGGPASNSLLNAELREKRGWVYGIECSYTQYAETGVFAISFGCDKPNLDKCTSAIERILKRLREVPLSDARLKAFRKQLLGQLAIGSESGEAQCLSMGKSLLAWGSIMSPEETKKHLEAITSADLQQMANRLFSPSNLSTLIYL
ncbi:MAG: insulinase family protein [Bacteroidales bacterium]|nr:insulinase family protein [Bacteroidales bacterium]